jgi:hypothetical protein
VREKIVFRDGLEPPKRVVLRDTFKRVLPIPLTSYLLRLPISPPELFKELVSKCGGKSYGISPPFKLKPNHKNHLIYEKP